MRPPTRSQFHHSDLGGPFAAFAPKFHECDKDLKRGTDSSHRLFYPTRHQRSSVLSILIDAFRRRGKDSFVVPDKRSGISDAQ
jgi:hypothetical protein